MKRDPKELTSLDDWLAEESILEEVTEKTKERVREIKEGVRNEK